MGTTTHENIYSFTLHNDEGEPVPLSDFRGSTLVLYFYPKDDTPGCTTQACELRDSWQQFEKDGVTIFGVSPDSAESHRKFRSKHGLPFRLLVDEGHRLADRYGLWVTKNMYGTSREGVERSTVIVDPDGRERVFRKVKPAEHVELLRRELDL